MRTPGTVRRLSLAVIATLVIMYMIPLIPYGLLSVLIGLEPPSDGSPVQFMVGVLVSKVGIALAFVLIYYLARESFRGRWLTYALVWFAMFVLGEIGQAIGPGYSWVEAMAGIVAEAIYCPLSALVVERIVARIEYSEVKK
jgi:hypothetical protein